MVCSASDSDGRSLIRSGAWASDSDLRISGGQVMHFVVRNENVLGTLIEIGTEGGEVQKAIIPPQAEQGFEFAKFGQEPLSWHFSISSDSDAFIVSWCLYSTWTPPEPVLDTVSPSSGRSGVSVLLSGGHFTGVTSVHFGAVDVPIVSATDTEISVTAPDGEGTVDITVTTPAGTSAVSDASKFTYETPAPTVTGIDPPAGASGIQVSVTGTGFTDVTDVGFGAVDVPIVSATDTEISIAAPDGQGTVDITVTTPAGTSAVSDASKFTYETPARVQSQ